MALGRYLSKALLLGHQQQLVTSLLMLSYWVRQFSRGIAIGTASPPAPGSCFRPLLRRLNDDDDDGDVGDDGKGCTTDLDLRRRKRKKGARFTWLDFAAQTVFLFK